MNLKKDIPRDSGNRLAEGATLLGEGNSPSDHSHASRTTPLMTKKREVENDSQYTEGINKNREKRTTALRRNKDTRPL